MDTINQTPEREPLLKRAAARFERDYEKGAFYILISWCLLPVFMSINYVIDGLLGKYPTAASLLAEGLTPGYVNYDRALRIYQTMYFIFGAVTVCFALLCLVFFRKRVFSRVSARKMPWYYLFALFLIWAGVSAFSSTYPRVALLGGFYMRDGYISYWIYASVFLCASTIRSKDYRRRLLQCFAAVICYLALIMLVQENFDIAFINYIFSSRRAAVFNQFNHFGYMLCMAVITLTGLFLYDRAAAKWLHWLYLAGVLYLFYALIINDTFGALLAALVALPAVLIFYLRSGRKISRRALLIVPALVLLAALALLALQASRGILTKNFSQFSKDLVKIFTHAEDAGNAGTNRFGLWVESVELIKENPILGVGPEAILGRYSLTDALLPHNTYLQIGACTGLVGLALYLAALVCLAADRWRRIRELPPMVLVAAGGAVAYLISEFVGCPVFNTEPYFWLFLGLVTGVTAGEKPLLCPGGADADERGSMPLTPRMERALGTFTRQHERAAFLLLFLWCLLPAVVSLLYPVMAALGKFPTTEEILSAGGTLGNVNYPAALQTYQTLFFVLGAVTVLFSLLCLTFCRQHVFSRKSLRENPWFYLLALLLGWATISSFCSDFFYHAFAGGSYVRDGFASYLIYAGVFLCALDIRREDYRRRLLQCYVGVMSYLALLMLAQELLDSAYLNYVFSSHHAVVFNQFNHFGYMLCMAFAGALGLFLYDSRNNRRLRLLYLALTLILGFSLIINNTFGAILAAVLALPLILWAYVRSGRELNRRAAGYTLLVVVLAGVFFFVLSSGGKNLGDNFAQLGRDLVKIATRADDAGDAGTGRLTLWRDTVRRIAQRPLFGFGPEGFIGANAITDDKRPHNEYLQIAGYLGIPALLFYLAAIVTLTARRWRRIRTLSPMVLVAGGMTTAYLISAFVGNPVFNTAPYFWMVLGLSAGACGEEVPLLSVPESVDALDVRRTRVFTCLGVLACALLCFGANRSLMNERERELEDLRTMLAADIAARELIGTSDVGEEPAFYWYDKQSGTLLPAVLSGPRPYGKGSGNSGGGLKTFYKETGLFYMYDESVDYAWQDIIVAASSDPSGGVKISVYWFNP